MIVFIFSVGACVGSFLWWLASQLFIPIHLWPRYSCCPQCHHRLHPLLLIPIVSQLSLRSRCYYCKKIISKHYIISEIMTGILFTLLYSQRCSWSEWCIVMILLIMTFSDIQTHHIPDTLQLMLLFIIIIASPQIHWMQSFILTCMFLFINFLYPHALGGADIKLFTILSLQLSYQLFIWLILLSASLGLIRITLAYYISRRIMEGIPFVPYILIAYVSLIILH